MGCGLREERLSILSPSSFPIGASPGGSEGTSAWQEAMDNGG